MKFLLTNDDGYFSEGIAALKAAASQLGECTIVAPDRVYSGCGHRINDKEFIPVSNGQAGVYVVSGTPADCSRLGLVKLAPDVDWVLAGINHGANLAGDIYMSGTAAAAREAALTGKPAIAFSQYFLLSKYPQDWDRTARWTVRLLKVLTAEKLEAGEFWNVNFPALPAEAKDPEIVFCRHDSCQMDLKFDWTPAGAMYKGVYQNRGRRPGYDIDVCFSGKIAVTRIGFDMSVV